MSYVRDRLRRRGGRYGFRRFYATEEANDEQHQDENKFYVHKSSFQFLLLAQAYLGESFFTYLTCPNTMCVIIVVLILTPGFRIPTMKCYVIVYIGLGVGMFFTLRSNRADVVQGRNPGLKPLLSGSYSVSRRIVCYVAPVTFHICKASIEQVCIHFNVAAPMSDYRGHFSRHTRASASGHSDWLQRNVESEDSTYNTHMIYHLIDCPDAKASESMSVHTYKMYIVS